MIIDHIGKVFFPDMALFRIVGRIAFPIYCYLLVRGANHTRNIKFYFFKVLLLGLISQPIFSYLFNTIQLNICFSLALSILTLKIVLSDKYKITVKVVVVILSCITSMILGFEYNAYGIIMVLLFSIKKIPILILSQLIWNVISIYVFSFSVYQIFAMLGIILCIVIGNKKKDNLYKIIPKGFNYMIYPIHLLVLLIIKINLR